MRAVGEAGVGPLGLGERSAPELGGEGLQGSLALEEEQGRRAV